VVANGPPPVVADAPVVANRAPVVANNAVANSTRHGQYSDKGRRKAYMRDLMRRKRAASRPAG